MKKLLFFFTLFLLFSCSDDDKKTQQYKIGTGGLKGVYWPIGNLIASITNENLANTKITAESTEGSVFNVNSILTKELDLGIIQSDRAFQVYSGIAEWQKLGPQTNFRVILGLHYETVTIIAAKDSNINSINDLINKNVNIGKIGSGTRQNAIDILAAHNINIDKINTQSLSNAKAVQLFQDKRIDAMFITVGHPSSIMKQMFSSQGRDARIIPIQIPTGFIEKHPYYAKSVIKSSIYEGLKSDIPSFGVRAFLCTRKTINDTFVYGIVNSIIKNFSFFKKQHKSLSTLELKDLLPQSTIPIHSGAEKAFKENNISN